MICNEWARLKHPSHFYRMGQSLAMFTVGALAKLWITKLNRCLISHKERFVDILAKRRKYPMPLISVSNHCSCLDDPFIIGALVPLWDLLRQNEMRWGMGAQDVLFKSKLHTEFFAYGRILPVVRGIGIYQPVMDFIIGLLDDNQWIHIFPQGKVLEGHNIQRLKWGVGRLVMGCKRTPIVMPIFIDGMERVLPNRPPYIPQIGKTVSIAVGENIDFSSTISSMQASGFKAAQIRSAIADRIQTELNSLSKQCQIS